MDFPNYLISETLDSGEIVVLNSVVKMTHRYRNGVYWTPFNYSHDLSALARTFKARKIDGKEIVKLGLIYKVKSNGEENKSIATPIKDAGLVERVLDSYNSVLQKKFDAIISRRK